MLPFPAMNQFSSVAYLLAFSHNLLNFCCEQELYLLWWWFGQNDKRWIGKNECSKKLQQRRIEYLFNYFIVFIIKAHDEIENCYLSLNNSLTRKVFQLPNKHFLTHKILRSPENEIRRRNARTMPVKENIFFYLLFLGLYSI